MSVPRSGPSQEDALLIAETGVSLPQLERWRAAGLVPRNARHGLGRGRGSTSSVSAGTAELVHALGRYAQRGRPVHEAVLVVFCGHPEVQLPEAAVRAALTWFSRDRGKGLVAAIRRAAPRGDHEGTTVTGGELARYDAAVDAAFEITGKLVTGRGKFLGMPITDPDLDSDRMAEAFPTLAIGLVLGLDTIGAREYARATGEMSEAIGQKRILSQDEVARLRMRMEARERAGRPLSPGAVGHSVGLISRSLEDVPFALICQVRDHLAIVGEAAAIRTAVMTADHVGQADSLPDEPALRWLEEACANSGELRTYLLFPPPFCTGNPRLGWTQATHFIVLTSICPGAPDRLGAAAHLIAPILPALRNLTLSAIGTAGPPHAARTIRLSPITECSGETRPLMHDPPVLFAGRAYCLGGLHITGLRACRWALGHSGFH